MSDLAEYYDQSVPPFLLPVVNPSTGATAGIPGTWTPAGTTAPRSLADLLDGNPTVIASPATAWTSGQYVQTGTAGPTGRATWTGTAWVGGAAPLFAPVGHSIVEVKAYIEALGDEADPDVIAETQRVLDEENDSDAPRSSLVAWLDAREGVV